MKDLRCYLEEYVRRSRQQIHVSTRYCALHKLIVAPLNTLLKHSQLPISSELGSHLP